MNALRRLFYRIFPRYRRLELRAVSYEVADRLIRESANKAKHEQWSIAREEDGNRVIGVVWLERRERIVG